VEHVEQREKKGLLKPHSVAIYAAGILALWILPTSGAKVDGPRDLVQPGIRVIALAKPELAPYGQAARESLQHLGLWNQVQSKIVYADNISMAKQYGSTGNADAVFIGYRLPTHPSGERRVSSLG
jgi:molybdate transport system substrate-binding protein